MARPKKSHKSPLETAFELLKSMGQVGQEIWEVAKPISDPGEQLAYIKKAVLHARNVAQDENYREPPLDFRTFVEHPNYMNKAGVLWPLVIAEAEEINSGKYTEVVLTGGIGVAKTTIALYSQAYQVYTLSCLRDPHRLFDLDPSSEILIVFQSINKNLAQDVDYKRFRDMCENSPYFMARFPFDKNRESDMKFPRRIIVKPVAGHDAAAIGQNVIGGIIDEVNFMSVVENSKTTVDGSVYDQATQNYNAIARRRESRFMQLGKLPGILCLVSSRNYPGQFTDKKEDEAKTNPLIYIYDKRIWDIRPERFSGETFSVFIGDAVRQPRLVDDPLSIKADDRRLIVQVPVEYRKQFETDLLAALRDIAGVATQALHPYIMNTEAVAACFNVVPSIASTAFVDFSLRKLKLYPDKIDHPHLARFAHVDLSISRDSAGVSMGYVPRFTQMNRGEHIEVLPVIRFDFVLEVIPPKNGEINFERIRRVLYACRDTVGIPLKWVSFDSFQSRDSMQLMANRGYTVGYQSMDTDTHAYDMTKQAFYDGRILAPLHPKAQHEFCTLEFDPVKSKIDHPPHSSKDLSDSMAGVVFGLTMRREIWSSHGVSPRQIPQSVKQILEDKKKAS